MSYTILPAEVRAVLNDVAAHAGEYGTHIASFEGNFQALLTAAKNPAALSSSVVAFAENVLNPAAETIIGRTTAASAAVVNVLAVVEAADGQMADDARAAEIQAAQSLAGGAVGPALYTGPSHGASVAVA